jgi:hypothetical protein
VPHTREQLRSAFARLDVTLTAMRNARVTDDVLWVAVGNLLQEPQGTVDEEDRTWWWEQLYVLMERHELTRAPRRSE